MGAALDSWAIVLIVFGGILTVLFVLKWIVQSWARRAYKKILESPRTQCDIDAFVGYDANPVNATKVVLLHKLRLGERVARSTPIPLEVFDSPHVPGLRIARKQGTVAEESLSKNVQKLEDALKSTNKKPVVIATIRMGFGHHRIAYAACSWALDAGYTTIFHDLLNIESPESELIKSTDELYSKFSRYASELGGPVERLWGSAMKSGDADALRVAALTAAHLQPLLTAYPKDIPLITTHQLVALTAACAGFTNVCNLVVDNYPQWFLTVPRTLNLVQGPVNYQSFMKMGIQAKELQWAGHWCPQDLVKNIPDDCERRIARIRSGQKPLRLLIPVGGAGAQRSFIINFIKALSPLVKQGKVQLFLNAGDHAHMKEAFLQVLDECGLQFDTISNTAGVMEFQRMLVDANKEPSKSVTLFSFDEYFPAVATTDITMRVSDVLCCKPSELAFYAVPKLSIRRVGDHEADSARRSSELGDGTCEAREISDAMRFVHMFMENADLLVSMNEAIMRNHQIGIYDGCQRAVTLATS